MRVELIIWTIFTVGFVQSQNEGSSLRINLPISLVRKYPNGLEKQAAMFGIPAYGHGKSITGILVFPQPNNRLGCDPIKKQDAIKPWPAMDQSRIVIVLLDRGNCTFVTKVRNSENVGAGAVIIANNLDDSRPLPYMADDGTGQALTIPSMIIRKGVGIDIKKQMENDTLVVVTMSWDMPADDGRVEWEFWTSSNDEVGLPFKKEFKQVVEVLGDSALFIPRYYIRNGDYYHCTRSDLPCRTQCTNNGRYCAVDPEGDFQIGLDGAHVIRENLRQICIWNQLNITGQQLKWWDYVVQFDTLCNTFLEKSWNESCSQNVMRQLRIDDVAVFQCVEENGGSKMNGTENQLLKDMVSEREKLGVYFLPTVTINGLAYRGTLSCAEPIDITACGVLTSICAGFKAGTEHAACLSSPGCALGAVRDICGVCGQNGKLDGCGQCLDQNDPAFKVNGMFDACGVCLNPGDKKWNMSCADCLGIVEGTRKFDECGVCGGPGKDLCGNCIPKNDPQRVTSANGGWDACGRCLHLDDPDWNKSCAGCDGQPNSGKINDDCGICDGPGRDICGTCNPERITKENGGWDRCNQCLHFNDPNWNKKCAGCDNVPNSGKVYDDCGVCDGPGKDLCGRCLSADHPLRITNKNGGIDECGICLKKDDVMWNAECSGCDGIPKSGLKDDDCGVCGGPGRDKCGNCFPVGDPARVEDENFDCSQANKSNVISGTPLWVTVVIITVSICTLAIFGTLCFRAREQRVRRDVDSLLKQYLPLEDTNEVNENGVGGIGSINNGAAEEGLVTKQPVEKPL